VLLIGQGLLLLLLLPGLQGPCLLPLLLLLVVVQLVDRVLLLVGSGLLLAPGLQAAAAAVQVAGPPWWCHQLLFERLPNTRWRSYIITKRRAYGALEE
jgi:hypothetical protein